MVRQASKALACGAAAVALGLVMPEAWAQQEVAAFGRTLYQSIMMWVGIVVVLSFIAALIFHLNNARQGVMVAGGVLFAAVLIGAATTFVRMTGIAVQM